MKIIIDKDIRKFQAGTIFEFDFKNKDVIFVVGCNGSGKSTLLNAIRAYKNDHVSETESLAFESIELSNSISVQNNEFEKIFHLSSVIDDSLSLYNACDAYNFVVNGGFGQRHISNGERTSAQFVNFFNKIKSEIIPNSTLLVFDEIDKGWDLKWQIRFAQFMQNLVYKYKVKILCATHNPISWINNEEVFSVSDNKFMSTIDYIKNEINEECEIIIKGIPKLRKVQDIEEESVAI